ncbi:MAG: chemotaxis protein CheA [Syntrophales bacterium]|jgi:two-component system chemotaxis sensor kinase CheA|nr:chemotaxis protein CheA [Syntrophales bacterium]
MNCDRILQLLNALASAFLFMDAREFDIPAAGKFLNSLDEIAREAESLGMRQVIAVSQEMGKTLEMLILDTLEDKGAGLASLGKGISRMQEIADSFKNTGGCPEEVPATAEKKAAAPAAESAAADGEPQEAQSAAPTAAKQDEEVKIQDEALLKDFITEGLEYIDQIEVNILNLEKNPTDKDYINAIFRPFHSIKGVASFLNLEAIRELAHNLENLLDKARNGELQVTSPVIDVVLDGADLLKTMIGQWKEILEGRRSAPDGMDLSGMYYRISKILQGEEDAPPQKLGEILVNEGVISKNDLDDGLKTISSSNKKIGETLISGGKATPKQVAQALRKQADQVGDASTIRVDTRKLDDLIDMVGELVITQSMIEQNVSLQSNADRKLLRNLSQFFRITAGLQRSSTSLRMIPIKQTFQRMSRLVRDLSKNAGKLIDVEMVGEDTEIDRNMVDEIYNPLVHMIRNSVDHGVETPEDRVRAGKPERGLIQLKAYHRGGNIVIEIGDDGRGLCKQKILDKAVRNGLVAAHDVLTDQEICRLIFLPGLSTAEKVTDVSGRGVGMDVVKQAVEKLRGKIEIDSTEGRGTTFTTSFPLTMAIIDGMIVKVGKERYILPTTAIRQALRPAKESYNNVVGQGEMINVMGRLLPVVRLYDHFGIQPQHKNPWDAIVVVVDGAGRSKCLLVDQIIGKAEVVIKSLGAELKKVKGVSGGAILGDGQIGLILDPEGLFELSENRSAERA